MGAKYRESRSTTTNGEGEKRGRRLKPDEIASDFSSPRRTSTALAKVAGSYELVRDGSALTASRLIKGRIATKYFPIELACHPAVPNITVSRRLALARYGIDPVGRSASPTN